MEDRIFLTAENEGNGIRFKAEGAEIELLLLFATIVRGIRQGTTATESALVDICRHPEEASEILSSIVSLKRRNGADN